LFSQIILVVEHTLKDDDGILQKCVPKGLMKWWFCLGYRLSTSMSCLTDLLDSCLLTRLDITRHDWIV